MTKTLFNEDGTVTLSKKTYEALIKCRNEYNMLKVYGVDNWSGYSEAMAELYGNEDDKEGDED